MKLTKEKVKWREKKKEEVENKTKRRAMSNALSK
jgi:hypothetical protein